MAFLVQIKGVISGVLAVWSSLLNEKDHSNSVNLDFELLTNITGLSIY